MEGKPATVQPDQNNETGVVDSTPKPEISEAESEAALEKLEFHANAMEGFKAPAAPAAKKKYLYYRGIYEYTGGEVDVVASDTATKRNRKGKAKTEGKNAFGPTLPVQTDEPSAELFDKLFSDPKGYTHLRHRAWADIPAVKKVVEENPSKFVNVTKGAHGYVTRASGN